jgi:hypothetical protein
MEPQDQNLRGHKAQEKAGMGQTKNPHMGPIHGKMEALGFREGKLFSSPERVTLTFFMGDQVASIHFDLVRREIFFKGHNVKNMTLTQEQWVALRNFSQLIRHEDCPPQIVAAYEECLGQVLPRL